jgi:hypothetical protein
MLQYLYSINLILRHILFRQAEVAAAGDDQVAVDRQVQGPAGLRLDGG